MHIVEVKGVICFGMGLTLRDGNMYEVNSKNNGKLMEVLHKRCKRNGILYDANEVFGYLHTFEGKNLPKQISLFDKGGFYEKSMFNHYFASLSINCY